MFSSSYVSYKNLPISANSAAPGSAAATPQPMLPFNLVPLPLSLVAPVY
jgi:hypothetical protein